MDDKVVPLSSYSHYASLLKPYLDNDDIIEIVINKPGEVWCEGSAGWTREHVSGLNITFLNGFAKLAASHSNQKITKDNPIISSTLPQGERCQIVMPPAVLNGYFSITIRKPSLVTKTISDFSAEGLFSRTIASNSELVSPENRELLDYYQQKNWEVFLQKAVLYKKNIIISGATGSGKTTLSKALINYIPDHERLITIEDTPELNIQQPNHVQLLYSKDDQGLAKITPKQLLESCLRMRPDRILLQELRDGTAFFYLRNVNSGHPGSITTVHANSAKLAFEQLMLLVKESEGGGDLERSEIMQILHMLVDVVIQMKRDNNGRRYVSEIYFEPANNSTSGKVA